SWSPCPGLPAEVFALRGAGDRLVAATADGLARSADGGRTWDPAGDLPGARHVRALDIRPDDPKYLLAGAAPGPAATATDDGAGTPRPPGLGFRLFESRDGGTSWAAVRRGFPDALEF